jgi:hypothetical protein
VVKLGRFRATYLLWIASLILGSAILGHTQGLFPPNIFGDLAKDLASSSVAIIVSFIVLLALHLISEESYPTACVFSSGLLIGIYFSFSWGISSAFTPVAIAAVPIFRVGVSGCTRAHNHSLHKDRRLG